MLPVKKYRISVDITTSIPQKDLGAVVLRTLGNPTARIVSVQEVEVDEEEKAVGEAIQARQRRTGFYDPVPPESACVGSMSLDGKLRMKGQDNEGIPE